MAGPAQSQRREDAIGVAPIARIAVVLACYNRRATTLRCLANLFGQAGTGFELSVHLFDDASPDGTAAAVREAHPQVTVVSGTGSAFWGGGMAAAMHSAATDRSDFILWLNDDVALTRDAVAGLLAAHARAEAAQGPGPHIIVGAVTNPDTGAITYAGWRRRNGWHPAQLERVEPHTGELTSADTMNGNCVLIPRAAVDLIGTIDPSLVHQLGDIDYGYRAVRAGCRIWVAPDPVGTCAPNTKPRAWKNPAASTGRRLRALFSPLGFPPRAWFTFMWRYAGPRGIVLVCYTYAKAMLGALLAGAGISATRTQPQK